MDETTYQFELVFHKPEGTSKDGVSLVRALMYSDIMDIQQCKVVGSESEGSTAVIQGTHEIEDMDLKDAGYMVVILRAKAIAKSHGFTLEH